MDIQKILKVNQKIEIEINSGPYQGTHQSKISEINKKNIKVLIPYNKGEILPLRKDLKLIIYTTGDTAVYKFKSTIIDRIKEPIPLLVIKHPVKVKRIQRRDFFRLDIIRKVKYCRINQKGEEIDTYKETTTSDISGGGVKIILNNTLNLDTLIKMYLDISEIEDIPIKGKVVQLYKLANGKAAGVEFVDLDTRTRDYIIGWIFDRQRELRKKGLL